MFVAGAHRLNDRRAASRRRNGLASAILPGAENRANTHQGPPRNLRGLLLSLVQPSAWGVAETENSWPPDPCWSPVGANYPAQRGYRRASTEARRDGRQESEALIVPAKPANPRRGEPVEGRRALDIEPLEGNMAGTPSPTTVSTQQQRIAELARQAPQVGVTSL